MNNSVSTKWNELFNSQKSQSIPDNETLEPGKITSYIFIFDCFENSILYFNSALKLLQVTVIYLLELLLEIIHPDDLPYFFQQEEKGLNFTNGLRFNEHFKYTLSYSYRIKTKNGTYIKILQECQAIEVNNSGHLTKTFVTHKKFHIQPKEK